jgi:glutathione S-transferase
VSLILHFHPLSSFCQKALIALYEKDIPFDTQLVDLMDPVRRAAYQKLWPIGKMPVLEDAARGRTVAEASIVIEYLELHYPGRVALVPKDPEQALEVRFLDRVFDLYVNEPVGKIVTDRLRPAGQSDALGVDQARERLTAAYGIIEEKLGARTWAAGAAFTLADCAAAPALFYAEKVQPFGAHRPNLAAYLKRLMGRPSYARALAEAEPFFQLFPG